MNTHADRKNEFKRSWLVLAVVFGLALLGGGAAAAEAQAAKVLIFSGTTGYRHADAINNGAPVIQNRLTNNPAQNGGPIEWDYLTCVDAACPAAVAPVFTDANLAQYDALFFFNNSSGGTPLWNASQRQAIINFVRNGGGIAGNHNATDMGNRNETWDWWDENSADSAVGALMNGHSATNINNVAQVQVADKNHPSTEMLPDTWGFGDEHYNFQRNVRGSHHVLATLDRSTYSVENGGGNASFGAQDHPIAWCTIRERDEVNPGGRVWLTAMGHFGASYTGSGPGSANFMNHLIGGIRYAAGLEGNDSDCEATVWENYERTTLVSDARGPIAIDVDSNGRVYWSELGPAIADTTFGFIKYHDQDSTPGNNNTVIQIPTRADWANSEKGVMGFSLDPDFDNNRNIFVYYSPVQDPGCTGNGAVTGKNQVSRFTLNEAGTAVVPGSERIILEVPSFIRCTGGSNDGLGGNGPGHVGGLALLFDADGNLVLGVGDDVTPNDGSAGGFAPLDGRTDSPTRLRYDARGTSANSNDLRGKVLRFKPMANPGETPGVGTTYTIPAGNMFAPGTPDTRPEIYAMGFRQPIYIGVDPDNADVMGVAEYGPDGSTNSSTRGPSGIIEWNLLRQPGFYGWPFCTGDQQTVNNYVAYAYPSGPAGSRYNCNTNPVPNDAPAAHNTGLANIPGPSIPATVWQKRNTGEGAPPANQNIGGGNAAEPWSGPIYRYDDNNHETGRFPAYWDGSWFFGERANNWWREMKIREDNNQMLRVNTVWPNTIGGGTSNNNMIPARFGPDGSLYYGKWTVGCCRSGNSNSATQIYKIDFTANDPSCDEDDLTAPEIEATVTGLQEGEDYINEATVEAAFDDQCEIVERQYRIQAGSGSFGPWTDYTEPFDLETPEGTDTVFTVEIRAEDQFGNEDTITEVVSVIGVIDTVPPTVTVDIAGSQDENDRYISSASVSVDATDALSGIESIEYRINGGAWTDYTEPVVFDETGFYTFDARATDTKGNVSPLQTVSFSVIPDCEYARSDEFNGTALDSSKWTFRHTRNGGTPAAATVVNNGMLTMPTSQYELDSGSAETARGPVNFIGQDLPSLGDDWQVETQFTITWPQQSTPYGWMQAGLIVWAPSGPIGSGPDNNFFRSTITRHDSTGNIFLEQSKDRPGGTDNEGQRTQSSGNPTILASTPDASVTIRMRYTRVPSSNVVTPEYMIVAPASAATTTWQTFPGITGGLDLDVSNPAPPSATPRRDSAGSVIGLIAFGNFTAHPNEASMEVDYFRVTPDEVVSCPEVDVEPPVTTAEVTPDPDGTNDWHTAGPVTVELTATDNESAPENITTEYRTDSGDEFEEYEGEISVSEEGVTTVEYRSVDEAGNTESIKSAVVKIDSAPPVTSPLVTDGMTENSQVLALNATDAASGVASIRYSIDGGGEATYTSPLSFTEDGSYDVAFYAIDNAGNVEAEQQITVNVGEEPELPVVETVLPYPLQAPWALSLRPSPEYVGPAIDKVMFKVIRDEVDLGGLWYEYAILPGGVDHPLQFTTPGHYSVHFYTLFVGGQKSGVQALTFDITDGPLPAPELAVNPAKSTLKGKVGKTVTAKLTITNDGDSPSVEGQICGESSSGKLKISGGSCQTLPALAVGESAQVQFKAKLKKGVTKSNKLTFETDVLGADNGSAKVKVKRK